MGELVMFRLKTRPTRVRVKQWLASNFDAFPDSVQNGVGRALFHGWRFVVSPEGQTYFANSIEPGISESEFLHVRSSIVGVQ
jgi:hypothetical protein